MSWTVTKLSESSESMVFRCVASAAVARPADIDGGDDQRTGRFNARPRGITKKTET